MPVRSTATRMDVGWRTSAGRDQDGRRIRKTVYAQTQAEARAKLIDLQARYLDLTVERSIFGSSRVAHAPMWDSGLRQHPRRWSAAVHFAARALDDSPDIRSSFHCQQGRRRSVLVAYALLRVRGHSAETAASLIHHHHHEACLVPAYVSSVETWFAAGALILRGPCGRTITNRPTTL